MRKKDRKARALRNQRKVSTAMSWKIRHLHLGSKMFVAPSPSATAAKSCWHTRHSRLSISHTHDLLTRAECFSSLGKKIPKWKMRLMSFLIAARSNLEPKYRLERCGKVKGMCKTFCDDVECDYGYCTKWRNQCCIWALGSRSTLERRSLEQRFTDSRVGGKKTFATLIEVLFFKSSILLFI